MRGPAAAHRAVGDLMRGRRRAPSADFGHVSVARVQDVTVGGVGRLLAEITGGESGGGVALVAA